MVKISNELLESILDAIASSNGIQASDIAKQLKVSPTAIHCGVMKLQEAGSISKGAGYYYNKQGVQVNQDNLWFYEK